LQAFIRRNGINESFFPLGAAIIEAVFAAGGAEIVGNQSAGPQPLDIKFSLRLFFSAGQENLFPPTSYYDYWLFVIRE